MDGNNFKQLRLRAGLSLRQACAGVMSSASLSKFENGLSDIGVDSLRGCLDNIGVSFLEFASMCETNGGTQNSYYYQVFRAYQQGDLKLLRQFAGERRHDYETTASLVSFYELVTTAGLYHALGGSQLLSDDMIARTQAMLMAATSWGEVEILSFAALCGDLAPEIVSQLAEHLLLKIDHIERRSELLYRDAWMAVLNAVENLAVRAPKLAAEVTTQCQKISIPENTLVVTLRLKFLMACQAADWMQVEHWLALMDFVEAPELRWHYERTATRLRTAIEGA